MEWISVKDRLPETNGDYLCAFNAGFISVVSWAENGWKLMVGSKNITHWMPPPKLPEDDR